MAAVPMTVRNNAAFTQCNAASAASKRSRRWRSTGRVVAATIRLADEGVHVVTPDLPVARLGLAGHDMDADEALARHVALHGRHVEAFRAVMVTCPLLPLHR